MYFPVLTHIRRNPLSLSTIVDADEIDVSVDMLETAVLEFPI